MTATTPNYILTAGGSITQPTLHIGLYMAGTQAAALDEAMPMATALAPAGYFNFWLQTPDGKEIGRLTVEQPKPVATFKAAQ